MMREFVVLVAMKTGHSLRTALVNVDIYEGTPEDYFESGSLFLKKELSK